MSDFQDIADALLAEIETALAPDPVALHRGFKPPADVTVGPSLPIFAMVYNPTETSAEEDHAQYERTTDFLCVLLRASEEFRDVGGVQVSPAFDKMSDDLDRIRNRLQRAWPPDPGPLGGLVDAISCAERAVDEVIDPAKVMGVMTIRTRDVGTT